MANLNLSPATPTSVTWSVSGLGSEFNQRYYQRVILSSSQVVTEGGLTPPANILNSISAPENGTSKNTPSQTTTGGSAFSAGNTYTLYATAQLEVGDDRYFRAGFATVTMPYPAPSPPTITTYLQGGFMLNWSSVIGANLYYLEYRIDQQSENWLSMQAVTGTAITLNVNTFGVRYNFRLKVVYNNNSYQYSGVNSGTSQPKTPSISGLVASSTTYTIYITMAGNWDNVAIERLTSSGSLVDVKTITSANGNDQTIQWNNIVPGTEHRFRARSNLISLTSPYSNEVVLKNTRPNNFSWTSDKKANEPFNLTAIEWNTFTARIDMFRQYCGKSQFGFTQAEKDKPFYAFMFNQAIDALLTIDNLNSQIPPVRPPAKVAKNDPVTAFGLNLLVTSLNSIT